MTEIFVVCHLRFLPAHCSVCIAAGRIHSRQNQDVALGGDDSPSRRTIRELRMKLEVKVDRGMEMGMSSVR